jgi:hypothetical protein
MEAEPKRENNKKIFCNHPKKGNQPRPDGSRADFSVLGVQLCSTIIANFPCVVLS